MCVVHVRRFILLLSVGALWALPAIGVRTAAQPGPYTLTNLNISGSSPIGWSTNASGDAVGWSTISGQYPQAFVVNGGTVQFAGTLLGSSASYMIAINDQRVAIGNHGLAFEVRRAAMRRPGGPWQPLGTLGGTDAAASSINNRMEIVGWADDASQRTRPYLWQNGVMTALPDLGGVFSEARWINDRGLIVGTSAGVNESQQRAVYWQSGEINAFSSAGVIFQFPVYVNNSGICAGFARFTDLPGNTRGALWRDGALFKRLGSLADGTPTEPFSTSAAASVNIHGTIVGTSTVNGPPSEPRAFVYHRGVMRDLSELVPAGWRIVNVGPGSLNDSGQIIAQAVFNNQFRVVRLTPVTAPCLGDITGDRSIGLMDVFALLDAMGCAAGFEACTGDIDNTGETDLLDYATLQTRLGRSCPP